MDRCGDFHFQFNRDLVHYCTREPEYASSSSERVQCNVFEVGQLMKLYRDVGHDVGGCGVNFCMLSHAFNIRNYITQCSQLEALVHDETCSCRNWERHQANTILYRTIRFDCMKLP